MDDIKIVDLYWARDEKAIEESDKKYGKMLRGMSKALLSSIEDAEECVNDTYLDAWGAMPDARPQFLGAFLAKITRRISIDRYRREHREKRGGVDNLIAELSECIPSDDGYESDLDSRAIRECLNSFLASLEKGKRVVFVLRYFYSESISEISDRMGMTESSVKVTLHRIRLDLKKRLEEQGLL